MTKSKVYGIRERRKGAYVKLVAQKEQLEKCNEWFCNNCKEFRQAFK